MNIKQLRDFLDKEEVKFNNDPQNKEVLGPFEHQEIVMWMWYDGQNHGYRHDWDIWMSLEAGCNYVMDFSLASINKHKEWVKGNIK